MTHRAHCLPVGPRTPRRFCGVIAVALAGAVACVPTEPQDGVRCPQTFEFGNYGCAVIAGRVVGTLAQPVPNALVGPSATLDGNQFNTPYATTEADGSFSLRLTRYRWTADDSVTLWIRAFIVPASTSATGAHDSVLVRARVVPVRAVPDTVYVHIVLPLR